jgi:putative phosphoesterase
MTRIGLLSDTHGFIPESVFTHFADVDEIWHAGDIGDVSTSNRLETFKPFRAVYGNIDGHELRARYPEHLSFTLEGVPVLMTHIGGYPPRYNKTIIPHLNQLKPHLFICGHSHILKVMPDATRQLLHINPGACGKQGWHKISTLVRFDLADGRVHNLEVIELGKR